MKQSPSPPRAAGIASPSVRPRAATGVHATPQNGAENAAAGRAAVQNLRGSSAASPPVTSAGGDRSSLENKLAMRERCPSASSPSPGQRFPRPAGSLASVNGVRQARFSNKVPGPTLGQAFPAGASRHTAAQRRDSLPRPHAGSVDFGTQTDECMLAAALAKQSCRSPSPDLVSGADTPCLEPTFQGGRPVLGMAPKGFRLARSPWDSLDPSTWPSPRVALGDGADKLWVPTAGSMRGAAGQLGAVFAGASPLDASPLGSARSPKHEAGKKLPWVAEEEREKDSAAFAALRARVQELEENLMSVTGDRDRLRSFVEDLASRLGQAGQTAKSIKPSAPGEDVEAPPVVRVELEQQGPESLHVEDDPRSVGSLSTGCTPAFTPVIATARLSLDELQAVLAPDNATAGEDGLAPREAMIVLSAGNAQEGRFQGRNSGASRGDGMSSASTCSEGRLSHGTGSPRGHEHLSPEPQEANRKTSGESLDVQASDSMVVANDVQLIQGINSANSCPVTVGLMSPPAPRRRLPSYDGRVQVADALRIHTNGFAVPAGPGAAGPVVTPVKEGAPQARWRGTHDAEHGVPGQAAIHSPAAFAARTISPLPQQRGITACPQRQHSPALVRPSALPPRQVSPPPGGLLRCTTAPGHLLGQRCLQPRVSAVPAPVVMPPASGSGARSSGPSSKSFPFPEVGSPELACAPPPTPRGVLPPPAPSSHSAASEGCLDAPRAASPALPRTGSRSPPPPPASFTHTGACSVPAPGLASPVVPHRSASGLCSPENAGPRGIRGMSAVDRSLTPERAAANFCGRSVSVKRKHFRQMWVLEREENYFVHVPAGANDPPRQESIFTTSAIMP
eukprot:TRINITY_DN59668_c0_g1_i1.p1 TRINITY_DN59668_c0_g1~~TRINITY_DN59668_c0_g1_i1.p1  ORF type:complete len:849 (+),score=109.00 TRINITY_DN59668_c0_g1_i1:155-2701(+)